MAIPFVRDLDPRYGQVVQVSPLLRRVVARNPGKFSYLGTGTYIVGRGHVAIVDPGPDLDEHIEAVLSAVDGETVTHLLITHTHRDHSPAWAAMAEATGAVAAGHGPHPALDTAARLADRTRRPPEEPGAADHPTGAAPEEPGDTTFDPELVLGHGDVVSGPGWTIEALHTPGHISNHLCFALTQERAVLTGDHVMGWSTTIIPPPDGSLTDYLQSCRLLLERDDDAVYWPTHGPPITEPRPFLEALVSHRLERTRQILDCLACGPATVGTMVESMYADTPAELHDAAGRSVTAHLLSLLAQGRVSVDHPVDEFGHTPADAIWSGIQVGSDPT